MVRIGLMAKRNLLIHRRTLLGALSAAALGPALPQRGLAVAAPKALLLRAVPGKIALRSPQAETAIWSLEGGMPLRVKRGEQAEITLQNDLPAPVVLNLRGLDGNPAAEPLTARPLLAPGRRTTLSVSFGDAGSLLCDIGLLADGVSAARSLPLVVEEGSAVSDHDEVLLIEDWRIAPDGAALAPGSDPGDAAVLLTVNGGLMPTIAARSGEQLRFRIINGCQRQVIAVKIEGHDIRVMALDGQPSEPFLARSGALVLAPGGRADALIDAMAPPGTTSAILLHDGKEAHAVARLATSTEPPLHPDPLRPAPALPANRLPAQLDLRNAQRIELLLSGSEWLRPLTFATSTAPAFRAKSGRVVVLALINRTATARVFHLHGHHFRLLDRLDDGWKPYWLDTLAIESGQTERVAFAPAHAGRWLMEAAGTEWSAPKLLRWYSVA